MEVLTHTAGHLGQVGHSLPTISKVFATWADEGSLWHACVASVVHLAAAQQRGRRVLHSDGPGSSGYKPQQGEQVIAMTDNQGSVSAPVPVAPVNATDMGL